MKQLALIIWLLFLIQGAWINHGHAETAAWEEIQGKNFVIYYESSAQQYQAQKLLRAADRYYQVIGEDIGYSRVIKFWTWEERVKIFLFKNRETFLNKTGQPEWSTGYANRDHQTFKSKTIMTYAQEDRFLDEILPHEISHLILHDFVGNPDRLPKWFDEGVAQLQELNKREMTHAAMKKLVPKNQFIPFSEFLNLDSRQIKDAMIAEVFYVQSLSVVEFLELVYGKEAFSRLCRELRNGKDFQGAMLTAYSGIIKDEKDLEIKWKTFVNR